MGKPVVATDIAGSGVPWVNRSGVTGQNVPVGDSQALAEALTADHRRRPRSPPGTPRPRASAT